jgi:hypothetical protein
VENPLNSPGVGPAPFRLREAWNWFWFNPADPIVLGLMRICAGLLALYVVLVYGWHLQAFFGEDAWLDLPTADLIRDEAPVMGVPGGWQEEPEQPLPEGAQGRQRVVEYEKTWGVDPRQTAAQGEIGWSVWFHVTDPAWMTVIHVAFLAVLVLFTAGFCTRLTSVLAWLGFLAYVNRSGLTEYGVDTILAVALMYLMIGPSGAALSVDRLLARWRAARKALAGGQPPSPLPPAPPLVSANLALRLLQVHLCFIYLRSALSKFQGDSWWDGTALWTVVTDYEFAPLRFEDYYNFLRALARHRWLWEIVMTTGAVYTLAVELCFPFLVWYPRLRWPLLIAALLLHLGIGLLMGLMTFSLAMLTLALAFVPPEAVHGLVRRLTQGPGGSRLIYDPRSPAQVRLAAAVCALDVGGRVAVEGRTAGPAAPVVPSPGAPDRFLLVTEMGAELAGYPLFERLARSLCLLWPLALFTWIPGMSRLGQALYPGTTSPAPSPSR